MADLVRGLLPLEAYCLLLRNLHALYDALEDGLQQRVDNPVLACVDHPAQHRRAPLEVDLLALHGPGWADALPVAATMQAYVQHLQHLTATNPLALVAHVYTRSLGDLHGGQILKDRVTRMLALPDHAGTAFYDFGPEGTVRALRQRLREGLACLPVTGEEEDAIVAEACWSFRQHVAVFSELARP